MDNAKWKELFQGALKEYVIFYQWLESWSKPAFLYLGMTDLGGLYDMFHDSGKVRKYL